MKNNRSELLDDEDVPVQKKATSTLIAISCLYIVIMFVGGFICSTLNPDYLRFSQRLGATLTFIIMSLFVALLTGILRVIFSKKARKKDENNNDPLWYKFIEEIFAIWVILAVLTLLKLWI